jgi:hypothetical protein
MRSQRGNVKRLLLLAVLIPVGLLVAPTQVAATPRQYSSEWRSAYGNTAGTVCRAAKRHGYVPASDSCYGALRADVDGERRGELVLLYGRPPTGAGATLKAYPATLEVVRTGGLLSTVRLVPTTPDPEILTVAKVNADPGAELFTVTSSGGGTAEVAVYSFRSGRLMRADARLYFGGNSALKFGFTCVHQPKPEILQHKFFLTGDGIWTETTYTYAWRAGKLALLSHTTTGYHGQPHGADIRPVACGSLPSDF